MRECIGTIMVLRTDDELFRALFNAIDGLRRGASGVDEVTLRAVQSQLELVDEELKARDRARRLEATGKHQRPSWNERKIPKRDV
jgi:hypothetical protein